MLNRGFLAPSPPADEPVTEDSPAVSDLTTLTPLHGRLSAIYAYSFFHLFNEAQQKQVAESFASLLSPQPGSVIFGCQFGMEREGERSETRSSGDVLHFYCHSPASWGRLWEQIFGPGKVRVESRLVDKSYIRQTLLRPGQRDDGRTYLFLEWAVIRI